MTEPFKSTYEVSHDSFLHYYFALAPCAAAALITSIVNGITDFSIVDVSYCISYIILLFLLLSCIDY